MWWRTGVLPMSCTLPSTIIIAIFLRSEEEQLASRLLIGHPSKVGQALGLDLTSGQPPPLPPRPPQPPCAGHEQSRSQPCVTEASLRQCHALLSAGQDQVGADGDESMGCTAQQLVSVPGSCPMEFTCAGVIIPRAAGLWGASSGSSNTATIHHSSSSAAALAAADRVSTTGAAFAEYGDYGGGDDTEAAQQSRRQMPATDGPATRPQPPQQPRGMRRLCAASNEGLSSESCPGSPYGSTREKKNHSSYWRGLDVPD